ncbi:MAG TPA: PAS domain S-box protein, partial [Cyanophyceae cyanobacterium]
MDIETFYVLLIDNNVATYEQIQTLLQEIQTIQVNLEWMHSGCVIEEGRHQCSVKSDRIYDACLIDTQLVAQNRRFLNEQEFPVIWLTDTLETGIAALRAGATDYLLYSQLSAPLLERSLRLTIAHFRTETQTRTLNTQLQQQLRERTQELQELQQELHQSKQSKMQRWKSESRLNALVNSTSDGLLIVDQRGIVRFVNPAATQLFNRTQEQLTNHEFGIPMIVGDVAEIGIFRPGGELGIGEMSITETEWEGEAAYVVSLRDITQRRQAEEALRDSEERFRQLADNIEDAFWLFSPYTEELFYVSPAFEKIWGRSCESMYAAPHTWIDTVHPDDRDIVSCAITQQLQGESTSIEYRIMRPDGEIRWVSARAFPIKNERYEVYRIAGIAEDISDRKRTEQALRNSEANYRQLAESVSDVFFAMDKTWRYIYWNKGSENLTGIPATEALGKSLYELFPDIQGTEIEAMYQDVMNNQQPRTCINQYQIQDQELFFEINAYPAQEGVSVFVKNITNRKQTEEALRRSEERFRTIFENSSIGIAVVGPDTKLVQTNPFFQQLVGYSGEELARLDYTHITHPDDLPLEQALAQDCIAGIRDSY